MSEVLYSGHDVVAVDQIDYVRWFLIDEHMMVNHGFDLLAIGGFDYLIGLKFFYFFFLNLSQSWYNCIEVEVIVKRHFNHLSICKMKE